MMTDYVELYPRDWVPDLTRTGGDRPATITMIPRQAWIDAGRPESIEDWQKCTIVAPAYAALNDAALKQFIDDAIAKERERVLKLIEAELLRHAIELPDDAGAPMERHHVRRVLKRIRKGEL